MICPSGPVCRRVLMQNSLARVAAQLPVARMSGAICGVSFDYDSRMSLRSCGLQSLSFHTPTHFPEIGLEPRGLAKNRDQLWLAGRRRIAIGETFQLAARIRGDLLIWRAGIFGNPDAVRIR